MRKKTVNKIFFYCLFFIFSTGVNVGAQPMTSQSDIEQLFDLSLEALMEIELE